MPSIADIVIIAAVAATIFFSVRSLLRKEKNGCSDCGGSCSGHADGHCSKAAGMIADAESAFAKKGGRRSA